LPEKESTELPQEAIRFLEHLAVERGASKNTLSSYRRDFSDFFGRHDNLNQEQVSQFLVELRAADLAESSIARKISALRSLESFLCKGDSARVPWRVELRKRGRRLPKSISYEAVRLLIESPGDDPLGIRDRAILEALYATGMRVSECISLNRDQFRDENEGISFLAITGKGGKERLVPVGGHARKACQEYLVRSRPILAGDHREPALFLNSAGHRLTRQGVWQIIKQAASRSGTSERVTPHVLRHSFATHMLERGADVRSVQELLGHASVVTTQVYTLITQEVLRESHAESHPRAR
jgi:integrase/recombinase XerD